MNIEQKMHYFLLSKRKKNPSFTSTLCTSNWIQIRYYSRDTVITGKRRELLIGIDCVNPPLGICGTDIVFLLF